MSGILERIEIRTPCPMDWDLMDGNDRVRFCDRCKKNGEKICGRIFRREDGTVVTADCPPRQNSQITARKNPIQFSMAALMMLVTFSAGLAASAPWIGAKIQPLIEQIFPPDNGMMVMGDMVAPMAAPIAAPQNIPAVIQGELSAPDDPF